MPYGTYRCVVLPTGRAPGFCPGLGVLDSYQFPYSGPFYMNEPYGTYRCVALPTGRAAGSSPGLCVLDSYRFPYSGSFYMNEPYGTDKCVALPTGRAPGHSTECPSPYCSSSMAEHGMHV